MKKTKLFLFIILLTGFGCKDQKSNPSLSEKDMKTSQEIGNNDYYLEYNEGFPDRYYLNNNTVMNGTFRVVENGVLIEEMYLENGVHNGVQKYFKNNSLVREISYKNGLKEGESKGYFEDGKIQSINTYKNDSLTGKSITYDRQGRVESERQSIDGLWFNKVYKEGKLIAEEYDYKHSGGILSIFKTYDINGKVTNVLGFDVKGMNGEVLYILNENHTILDSINPKKNPMKAMELLQKIDSQFMQ